MKVHQSHQDCLFLSAFLMLHVKRCKGQKSTPRVPSPPMSATRGLGTVPTCLFPTALRHPELQKLLTRGNSRDKGLRMWQQVRRPELGSGGEVTALRLRASASQPISSRNTSTPPTFWPGTEPYVCSLWEPLFFQRSPAFMLCTPAARLPWVRHESLWCGYLKCVF